MFGSLAKSLFGSGTNDRAVKRYASQVAAVNALEDETAALSDLTESNHICVAMWPNGVGRLEPGKRNFCQPGTNQAKPIWQSGGRPNLAGCAFWRTNC